MWDVIWTDPDRELVGEHRAKKGRSQEEKEKNGIGSGRNSAATSHSSSSSESPFGFFRSKASRRADAPNKSTPVRPPSLSGLASPSLLSSLSPFSQTFDAVSRRSSGIITTAPTSPNKDTLEVGRYSSENTDIRAGHISFTSCTSGAEALYRGVDCPKPPNAQSTKLTGDVFSREIDETTRLMKLLGKAAINPELPDIPRYLANTSNGLQSSSITTPPVSPRSPKRNQLQGLESPIALVPPPKSPLRHAATKLTINNPAAWRRPEQWTNEQGPMNSLDNAVQTAAQQLTTETFESQPVESNVKHDVHTMASVPPTAILSRLNTLSRPPMEKTTDFEAEQEKTQWMLSVLHHLDVRTPTSRGVLPESSVERTEAMLVLHEPLVVAQYLDALFGDTRIYHFTQDQVAYGECSAIQSLQVPCRASEPFPIAPKTFKTVYSLSLPSLYPYNELPVLLGNVYSSLKEKGAFRLTVIDPLPYAETLGEKMRSWLEENLLRNLEQNSRCVEPSRLLPKLLGEAGLRGKGSRRTKIKFHALRASAIGLEYHDPDPCIERLRVEKEAKAELRSAVGRMLWLQVWGKYINGPTTWWWDDEECLEECLRLGTFWEYHVIEAVKSD